LPYEPGVRTMRAGGCVLLAPAEFVSCARETAAGEHRVARASRRVAVLGMGSTSSLHRCDDLKEVAVYQGGVLPSPLPLPGYFGRKFFGMFGLRDGWVCKILIRDNLRPKYLESAS
jgi:hypothetical protein